MYKNKGQRELRFLAASFNIDDIIIIEGLENLKCSFVFDRVTLSLLLTDGTLVWEDPNEGYRTVLSCGTAYAVQGCFNGKSVD